MKLQPKDIMQFGDIAHCHQDDMVIKGWAGHAVNELETFQHGTWVERPDPEPNLREHVRTLREALEFYADEGNYCHDDAGNFIASAYRNNRLGNNARAALEQTK